MQLNEFSYGSINSCRFCITCDTEVHTLLPEQRQYVTEIPGLDGVYDFNIKGYGTLNITRTLYFDGDYSFLRAHRDEIIAWLSNDGQYKQLIFGDEQDKYYMAKVIAGLELSNAKDRVIGTVSFICNPPWKFSADGLALTPEYYQLVSDSVHGGQFVCVIENTPKTLKLYNVGRPVKPIIKLIGYCPGKVSLTFLGNTITLNSTAKEFGGIVIDCESETVVRMSDQENMFPIMQGGFITLPHGYSEIVFQGIENGQYPASLTAIVEFTPVYGG